MQNAKRKVEGDFHAIQEDIEELENEARAAEDRANKALAEVNEALYTILWFSPSRDKFITIRPFTAYPCILRENKEIQDQPRASIRRTVCNLKVMMYQIEYSDISSSSD